MYAENDTAQCSKVSGRVTRKKWQWTVYKCREMTALIHTRKGSCVRTLIDTLGHRLRYLLEGRRPSSNSTRVALKSFSWYNTPNMLHHALTSPIHFTSSRSSVQMTKRIHRIRTVARLLVKWLCMPSILVPSFFPGKSFQTEVSNVGTERRLT